MKDTISGADEQSTRNALDVKGQAPTMKKEAQLRAIPSGDWLGKSLETSRDSGC